MPTFNQLVRKGRQTLQKKSTAPAQPDPQPEQPAQDSQPSGGTDNSGGNSEDDWWHGPVLSAPTDNGCTQEEIDAGGC